MGKSNSNGFTLIELLVVIGMIGLLLTMGIVVYTQAQKNARDIKRKSDLRDIKTALQSYYTSNRQYPINTENDNGGFDCSNRGSSFISPISSYFKTQPTDPKPVDPYNGCGFMYYRYAPSDTTSGGCNTYFYVAMVKMEIAENSDMKDIPDCYVQKASYQSSGWSGVGELE